MDSYINNRLGKRRKRRWIRLLIFTFVLLIAGYILFGKFINDPTKIVKPSDSLENVVQNALEGTKGLYGIVIKNLKTGESYYSNKHKIYEPGSLYKLWVMAVVYKQIQAGTLKEDQVLSEDVATLNDKFKIDPDLAELTDGAVTFSLHDALNQMITISHNYAALLLTEQVKLSSVASFLKENGFNESTVGTDGGFPTSTPYDIALFFEKLYKGELVNEQYTKEMIDLLKNQQLNDKLPKYLPQDIDVAHKTGEINFATHDAGIVYAPNGEDYIIVVLSDSNSPPGATDRIAEVSKVVYNYFTNKYN